LSRTASSQSGINVEAGNAAGAAAATRLGVGCWKTSPQRHHVMRLVREISWQESDQSDNFDRRLKFLKISSTTYIENKQYTEF